MSFEKIPSGSLARLFLLATPFLGCEICAFQFSWVPERSATRGGGHITLMSMPPSSCGSVLSVSLGSIRNLPPDFTGMREMAWSVTSVIFPANTHRKQVLEKKIKALPLKSRTLLKLCW